MHSKAYETKLRKKILCADIAIEVQQEAIKQLGVDRELSEYLQGFANWLFSRIDYY